MSTPTIEAEAKAQKCADAIVAIGGALHGVVGDYGGATEVERLEKMKTKLLELYTINSNREEALAGAGGCKGTVSVQVGSGWFWCYVCDQFVTASKWTQHRHEKGRGDKMLLEAMFQIRKTRFDLGTTLRAQGSDEEDTSDSEEEDTSDSEEEEAGAAAAGPPAKRARTAGEAAAPPPRKRSCTCKRVGCTTGKPATYRELSLDTQPRRRSGIKKCKRPGCETGKAADYRDMRQDDFSKKYMCSACGAEAQGQGLPVVAGKMWRLAVKRHNNDLPAAKADVLSRLQRRHAAAAAAAGGADGGDAVCPE